MAGLLAGMPGGLETNIWRKHTQSMQDMKSATPDRSRESSFTSPGSRIPVQPQASSQGSGPLPAFSLASSPPRQQQGGLRQPPRPAVPGRTSFQDVQFDGLLATAGFGKANRRAWQLRL